ncbi:MAG TPA: hypothetical protein VF173_09735 [Thermoanaerobaculia bacterium]|nr:hypothetical protein [Thermoanaerobaculia bacterium]
MAQFVLPPPTSPDEFEDLVMELLRHRFNLPGLVRYGRHGQRQDGIDGYDSGTNPKGLVWQATLQANGLDKKLKHDHQRALGSLLCPSRYVFVSAAPRDVKLTHLAGRLTSPSCQVQVLCWDDLWSDLTIHTDILEKHYGWWLRSRPWWESTVLFVLLLLLTSLMGGAMWVYFWRKLGGTVEPHGIAALMWPLVSNVLTCATCWLFSRRAGVSLPEVGRFLLGLSVGSWLFYDLPVANHHGIRSAIGGLGWSPFSSEAVLVVAWSLMLSVPAHSFAILGRPLAVRRPQDEIRRRLLGVALAVCFASVPVWCFIGLFPTSDFESARGIIAGVSLRVGLGLGLALPFLEWRYLRHKSRVAAGIFHA